jgi:hypothetical protein
MSTLHKRGVPVRANAVEFIRAADTSYDRRLNKDEFYVIMSMVPAKVRRVALPARLSLSPGRFEAHAKPTCEPMPKPRSNRNPNPRIRRLVPTR